MNTPARAAPKYHLLFLLLLSILLVIVCSSGVFFSPAKDIEQQKQRQLQKEDQIFLSSRRKLLTKTTMHNLLNFFTSNSPALVTVPSTTAVTNPMSPLTNSVTTPGTSDSVVAPNPPPPMGQMWCVANNELLAASLQGALDYACGHGADCGAIQQGGNCYYPNTVQDHASYAFNNYYHNHSNERSCDFKGAAVVTHVNPSSGTCIYPSSSSSTIVPPTTPTPTAPSSTTVPPPTTTPAPKAAPSSTTVPPTTTTTTPTPKTTTIPTPTTAASSGNPATPPSISNGNNSGLGGSIMGFGIPPITSPSPISMSSNLHQSFIGCIIVATSFITWIIVLDI